MTRTGDREIRSVSGRLPDNPGELACMRYVGRGVHKIHMIQNGCCLLVETVRHNSINNHVVLLFL